MKAVNADLEVPQYVATGQALCLINSFVTKPLWKYYIIETERNSSGSSSECMAINTPSNYKFNILRRFYAECT